MAVNSIHQICDAYEYYPEIDLAKYLEKPSSQSTKYKLYSVLVHNGTGAVSGHYYAFLRPQKGFCLTLLGQLFNFSCSK